MTTLLASDLGRETGMLSAALQLQFTKAVADITALRAAVVAITAKLDADGGVTDTNYAATCNPAAQTSAAITITAS